MGHEEKKKNREKHQIDSQESKSTKNAMVKFLLTVK